MIYPRVLAALLLSGGMASVAVAAPPVMLNDALITQISKADRASFHEAVAQALNSSADGQSTEWKSAHQPKRAAPITVQLTPKQTTKADNDRVCRFLVPVRQAIAAEAGQVHQVDVLDIRAMAQMRDEPAEGSRLELGPGLVIDILHGGLMG